MKTTKLITLACAAAMAWAMTAGAVLVNEYWDYSVSNNSSVSGLSGGSGWTGNWTVARSESGYFQDVNLTYSGTTGYVNPAVTNNGSIGLRSVNNTGNYTTNYEARTFDPGISGTSTI